MKVKCFQLSSAGVVRDHNEDFIAFWQPDDFEQLQGIGSLAVLADGVGGLGNGELASRMAAETALEIFKQAKPQTQVNDLAREIFDQVSNKVFQESRNNGEDVHHAVAHDFSRRQGDHRARGGFAGVFGPGGKNQADDNGPFLHVAPGETGAVARAQRDDQPEHRSTLTRSVGSEPMCHYAITTGARC